MRRRLSVLVATVMMLAMAAGPAVAAPGGNGQGFGQGQGGGDFVHADNGKHTAKGGGKLNNPHNGVCGAC